MSSMSFRCGSLSPSSARSGSSHLVGDRPAGQAGHGAVVVRVGDTMTLVAAVAAPGREGRDFFPLTVDYREKIYAAGKFPGGFIKREGRPDHQGNPDLPPHRPAHPPALPRPYLDEVQIQAGPLSADRENDPDILSMIGAVASLHAVPHPLPRPDRRRPHRPHRRRVHRHADARRAGGERPRPDRRRHAQRHHHDRGLRPRDVRGRDARGDPVGAPAEPGDHRRCSTSCSRRSGWPRNERPAAPPPTRCGRCSTSATATSSARRKQTDGKAERNDAVKELLKRIAAELCPEGQARRAHPRPGHGRLRRPGRARRPRPDPRRQAHRRPRPQGPPPDHLRGRPAAAHARLGPLPARRDAGAGDDRRSAPPATSSASTA